MARILLVQDDMELASGLEQALRSRGHDPVVVQTAGAALREFQTTLPDLIVSAIVLPDNSGTVLVGRIRSLPGGRRIPVILTSQVYRTSDIEASQLSRLGVRYFLAKPFSVTDVIRRIDSLVPPPPPTTVRDDLDGSVGATREIDIESMGFGRAPAEPAPPVAERESTQEVTLDIGRASSGAPPLPLRPAVRNLPVAKNTPGHFVRTVADLFHGRDSGRLRLHGVDCDRTFYFLNGYPVWVDVDPPLLGVPEWLQARGRLNEAEAMKAAAAQTRLGWSITRVLVSQQVMTAAELDPLLQAWVEHELSVATNREGTLEFRGGDAFAESIPVYETNPVSVLWSVIDQSLRLGRAEIGLVPVEASYLRRRNTHDRLFGYIATTSVLQELREWLAQARSFEAIREYFSGDWEQVARCLWFLVHTQIVKVTADPPDASDVTSFASIPVVGSSADADEPSSEVTARFSRDMIARLVTEADQRKASEASEDDPEVLVIRHYVTRMEMDHYAFLELEAEATGEEVQAGFDAAAGRYRPSALPASARPDTRRKAKELLARAVRAYGVLKDETSRRAYDAGLGEDDTTGSWDTAEVVVVEDDDEYEIEIEVEGEGEGEEDGWFQPPD